MLRGLPADRTSVGAGLVDISSELASGIGSAATGTILAALVTGSIAAPGWSAAQHAQFGAPAPVAGLTLAAVAAALVAVRIVRSWRAPAPQQGH